MPSVPFNATVWPASVKPLASNAEIVRVTNVSGDTLTITRAQEGTAAISIAVGYQFSATITAKTLTDAETSYAHLLGANTAGNTTASGSTLGFSGVNLTLSGTNGSQMVLSVPATSSYSVTGALSLSVNGSTISVGAGPMSAYAVSNTTQATSGAVDMRSLSFHGAGGVSVGVSNGSVVISGATGGGGGGGGIGAGVSTGGNTAGATGTITTGNLVLVGSGPISLSQATGGAGSNATVTINAPATSSLSATGAVSISTNGSTISIGAPTQTNQTLGLYHISNTTGQSSSSTVDARSLSFAGAGVASVGMSGGSVLISVPSGGGAGDGVNILAAGTQTAATTGTVLFQNSNGLTFGMSNSSVITASHNGLTSQSNQNVTAANGGFAFQTLSFSNLNGISFGTSAGSAITASHNALTTARASNDAVGLNTALTAGPLAWTVNSAGLSLNAGSAAGTTSGFGGNLISGSMTHNTAGLNLSLNHPAWLTTAALSNHSHGNPTLNLTNLSGTTASNSAGFTLSLSAGAGGGVTPVASASNGSFSFTTLAFSNANNVTFGTSAGSIITASVAAPGAAAENNWVNLLGANTAGNTTASGSTIGYSGINLTLSGTNGSVVNISAPATSSLSATGILSISTNGSTISIGVGRTISGLALVPFGGAGGPLPFAQSSISLGQNSLYVYPVQVEDYLTLDHVRMPVLITNSSSAVSSGRKGLTYQLGVYSRNATNNTILTQLWSTSYTIAASYSSNASWAQSMITAIGNSTSYNSVTASSAGVNLSASLHGPRELIWPVSTLLSPGEYWVAVAASTSGAGTVGNVLNISNLAVAYQTYNRPGLSTNATHSGWFKFMGAGTYSVTTGALPNGISATQINQLGTLPIMFAATGTV